MIKRRFRVAVFMLVVVAGVALYVIAERPSVITNENAPSRPSINKSSVISQPPVQAQGRVPENNEDGSQYLLRTHGYPKEVPLLQAVEECNRRIQSTQVGKTQPPLTVDEVVAAIRDLKPEGGSITPQMYKTIQDVAKLGVMPKGSYFYFTTGTVSYNGYDIDALRIFLRVGLDKYPEDVKGVPVYSVQIRSQYISSRPTNLQQF